MSESEDTHEAEARPATGRRRNTRTHAAILDATMELLAEVGYQDMSIERVAARAGVGKATIYRWWQGKGPLVLEALQSRVPLAAIALTGDPRTDLRAVIQVAADTYSADVVGAALPALASSIETDSPSGDLLCQFLRPQRDLARRILHHAAAIGAVPPDIDIELVIDLCIGTVLYRALIGGSSVDADMVERLTSLIVDSRLPRITQNAVDGARRPRLVRGPSTAKRERRSQSPAVFASSSGQDR